MSDSYDSEERRGERRARRALRRDWRGNSGVFTGVRSPAGRMFFAVALIVAGVLLFLDNLGIIPLRDLWQYSPLLTAAWGIWIISGATTMTRRYWGVLLIGFGAFGTLLNLGVLRLHTRDDSWPLALLLIAFGVLALIRTVEGGSGAPAAVNVNNEPIQPRASLSDNVLNEQTVFGSIKRRVETPNFLGGQIECVFGSVELDLRYSQIVPNGGPVTVDVKCVFGATKMRIPDTWLVTVQAAGVFGNVEDRTIPPRTTNGMAAPMLMISGESVFASVEIEN